MRPFQNFLSMIERISSAGFKARNFSTIAVVLGVTQLALGQSRSASEYQARQFVERVSHDLAALKSNYPQLVEFSRSKATDIANLKIVYGFHTHRVDHPGGWTASVPNPDPDGLWFYIDVHDATSNAQIHTQPQNGSICFGTNRVSFLILEGPRTRPLGAAIWRILQKHGARPCRPEAPEVGAAGTSGARDTRPTGP